ncbi:O-antigen polymerase [Allopontixanthobacter sp.]|uniref:O-antigen polymerase n=1 Tax=Allopontixanthobacter sp. TaxID=2906452 RepID=UPI002ABB5642|nr:O-antigen polymerase [Allopontixanthobacter sp.]MDZ4307490.1 O-antigen polymerase [Allopontixanthobacter sp.]
MYEAVMLANLLLWIIMAVLFIRQPAASAFHPFAFYLAFHFLVFVIRPPLVYYRGYDLIYTAYQFQPSMAEKTTALLATMLGLIAFGLTNLHIARTPISFSRGRVDEIMRNRLGKPFLLMALLLAPVAVYSMLTSWATDISGAGQMITDSATGIAVNTQSNGYFYESRLMLGPIAVIFAWITRFRWYSFIPLILFIILGGGTGTRGPFMLAAVAMGLIWLYESRRLWPSAKMVLAGLVVLGVFNLVGQDRGYAVRGLFVEEQVESWESEGDARFLEGMDAGNLEYMEYLTYAIPERTGTYTYFLGNLQALTEPVPRVLWEGKPLGEPIKFFSLFDYGTPMGMTRSLPGEGWYSLGFAGVFLWCALFGGVWGAFYEYFARGRPTNLRLLAYMILLPLSILFYRDGVLVTMLRFLIFLVFPLIVLNLSMRLLGVRTPRLTSGGMGSGDAPAALSAVGSGHVSQAAPNRAQKARLAAPTAIARKLPRAYRSRNLAAGPRR